MSTPALYTSQMSPYGARVRIALAYRDLPVILRAPPDGRRSPERFAMTPLAKFPILQDGGCRVVESLAILEYLEDRYRTEKTLLPQDPCARAMVRSIAFGFDNNVVPAMSPIFAELMGGAPDPNTIEEALNAIAEAWGEVAGLFDDGKLAVGDQFSLADCSMAPFAVTLGMIAQRFGAKPPEQQVDRLALWRARVFEEPSVLAVQETMEDAFRAAFMTPAG